MIKRTAYSNATLTSGNINMRDFEGGTRLDDFRPWHLLVTFS